MGVNLGRGSPLTGAEAVPLLAILSATKSGEVTVVTSGCRCFIVFRRPWVVDPGSQALPPLADCADRLSSENTIHNTACASRNIPVRAEDRPRTAHQMHLDKGDAAVWDGFRCREGAPGAAGIPRVQARLRALKRYCRTSRAGGTPPPICVLAQQGPRPALACATQHDGQSETIIRNFV